MFGAGRPQELRAALQELLADREALEEMGRSALAAARGPYSWSAVAGQTLALYRELLG